MSALIIGAGIAGLTAARELSRRGVGDVIVIERERLALTQSSGRNAAIFRPLEESRAITELAGRSRALMDSLGNYVSSSGLILSARTDPGKRLRDLPHLSLTKHAWLPEQQLFDRAPALRGSRLPGGMWLPEGGVIDLAELGGRIRQDCVDGGVSIRTDGEVAQILQADGRVRGVQLTDGSTMTATEVVIAAGAWAASLGEQCGCPLPLVPHRRHLAHLSSKVALAASHPVCWNVESGVYLRPESRGVLACPGDHEPWHPCLPVPTLVAMESLAEKLPREAPLLGEYSLRNYWACLRTMSPDQHMVLGRDPRLPGLSWFAGLAGHGMTTALAAAEVLALHITKNRPVPNALSVQRWLASVS